MKRILLLLSPICVLFAACQEPRSPTGVTPPSALLRDGAHNGGNPHFFFLPPLVSQPRFSGVFNPNLKPVVVICELDVSTTPAACSGAPPIDPGPVTADLAGQHYKVNWDTRQSSISLDKFYRIQVFGSRGGLLLGFADVDPVGNGSQLKNVNTGEYIGLVDGRTLPIKFRIERGALTSSGDCTDCAEQTVGPAGGTVITNSNLAGAFFPPNALSQDVTVIIEHDASQPCLPIDLVQRGGCYQFRTDPGPTVFRVDVTAGICVETAGLSIAEQRLLHLHKLDFEDEEAVVTPLENVAAAFLPCDEPIPPPIGLTPPGRGVVALAVAGWHQLVRLAMPTPLSAAHVGVGGLTGSFSRIGWALPAQMAVNAGDGQTAVVGTAVVTPPSVIITDSSGTPISGETVTFSVGSGGGSITGGVTTTGTNGVASVGSWTLGGAAGTNTLIATSVGAVGSPRTFTATATATGGVDLVTVNLSSTTLIIDGPNVAYTATAVNGTGEPLSIVVLQGWIDQGDASRAAGGLQVVCGDDIGTLPPGTCNFSFSVVASNATTGSGTLVPGSATARFQLQQGETVLDTFTVPVTLVGE
jgi:hypothetical protein